VSDKNDSLAVHLDAQALFDLIHGKSFVRASILLFHGEGNLLYILANDPMPLELTRVSAAGNW
jgi:hypothetical protein